MKKFDKALRTITEKLAYGGMVAIVVCVAFVVSDVVQRSLGFGRINGIYEIVELVAACIMSLGIGYLTFVKGHVAVGLVIDRLSPRKQAAFDVINYAISLVLTVLLTWAMFERGSYYQDIGAHTAVLRVPIHLFVYVIAGSLVATCLVLVKDLTGSAIVFLKGKEVV